mgnify:CR=1 FL=1
MAETRQDVGSCIIKIDGQTTVETTTSGQASTGNNLAAYLESVQVDRRLDAPDMFSFELDIRSDEKAQLVDDLHEGKSVEILLGPVGKEQTVFKGEIHYIEPHFRYEGSSTVVVGGYDHSHRLTRGTTSRTWGDGVQQQDLVPTAVRDVISKAADSGGTRDGLSPSTVETPRAQSAYIPQMNVSDYHFMKWLGQDVDRSVEANTAQDDTQINFRPPDLSRDPVVTLVRDAPRGETERQVKDARFSLSTVRQVAKVEVRGWDPKRKKAIVGVATDAAYRFDGKEGWKASGQGLYGSESAGKVLTITDRPVDSKEEADAVAKSIFTQLSMDFLTGEVEFEGDPKVTAGDMVAIRGFGKRFDGKYLVGSCVHEMTPKTIGYVTRVRLSRNSAGQ